tara:strand:+ start:50101 stop:50832 length:732 start_codon:yes stop_codon:yes gene_type:complete
LKIIKLNAIDSTNTYLKNLSKKVALEDELIVITEKQTAGRGQMHSQWSSSVGQSLTFSVFKRFDNLRVGEQPTITYATSLGLKNGLEKLQIPAISIKWPNDILSYKKKLCGVLIENQTLGDKIVSSVIGIGLNVNEMNFPQLPQATSMKLTSGINYDLGEVFEVISSEILSSLNKIAGNSSEALKQEYENVLFRKDRVSVFEDISGEKFSGIIRGISNSGKLKIELADESLQKYELKQIKMLY